MGLLIGGCRWRSAHAEPALGYCLHQGPPGAATTIRMGKGLGIYRGWPYTTNGRRQQLQIQKIRRHPRNQLKQSRDRLCGKLSNFQLRELAEWTTEVIQEKPKDPK